MHAGARVVVELVRSHAVFAAFLAAGLALRVITLLAYRPAIINVDAAGYLENAADLEPNPIRPIGYPLFLRALWASEGLTQVVAVQHLLGLATGVLLYAALVRLGVVRWLAALACAPLLLDAIQLNIEQTILSESLFVALVVAGCAILVWNRPPGLRACAAAGLVLAVAALTRSAGLPVLVPALLGALFLGARVRHAAVLVAAFAVPLVAYATWFYGVHGVFTLNGYGGQFLYARVAPFADCDRREVPAEQRVLCPSEPVGERPTSDQFVWSPELSPLFRVEVNPADGRPAWAQRSDLAADFALSTIAGQPGTYAQRVASDFARSFAPTRSGRAGEVPAERWQFQLELRPSERRTRVLEENGGGEASVQPGLAAFLRGYQRFGYTPGPVLAACLLLGLAGAVGIGRAWRAGLRAATFLFTGVGLTALLVPVATALFSWRYQLPQLALLPPAGALGLATLLGDRLRESGREPRTR